MGGVNLADMLISFYHKNIKCKRWYLKIIFLLPGYLQGECLAALQTSLQTNWYHKKKRTDILDFINQICEHLLQFGKSSSFKKMSRQKHLSKRNNTAAKRGRPEALPIIAVR